MTFEIDMHRVTLMFVEVLHFIIDQLAKCK